MKRNAWIAALLWCCFAFPLAAEEYQVIFETTECSGQSGFAAVKINTIYRIEEADCAAPNNPKEKLKRMLVNDGSGSYTAYTLTPEEAQNVVTEMRAYMKARLKLMERSNAIIIGK
jgi:hypothetical protein